jgi:putative hydrolase of the HAD superfamily
LPHRAVFFDFGGTLFPYESSHASIDRLLQDMAARREVAKPLAELRRLYRTALSRVMAAYTERPFYLHRELFAEAHVAFLESLGVTPAQTDGDVVHAGRRVLGEARVELRDAAAETLVALRARGLQLSLVSNIDDEQFELLWPRLGLDGLFDRVTTSEEARSCKPDAGIFQLALEKAGHPEPARVLFVGDSVDHDVVGANAIGMTSVLIAKKVREGTGLRAPDHVISDLRQLLEIVDLATTAASRLS